MLYDGIHFSDPGSRRVATIVESALIPEIQRLMEKRRQGKGAL